MIDELLPIPYVVGGRSMEGADCWGLALLVRERLGLPAFDAFPSIRWDRPHGNQKCYQAATRLLVAGDPAPGAFAAVFRGPLCLHVGVCLEIESRLCVVETNVEGGVRWYTVDDYNQVYPKVVYYHDAENLS